MDKTAFSGDLTARKILSSAAKSLPLFDAELNNESGQEQSQTVNGWLIKSFGEIPRENDTAQIDGFRVKILSVDQTKILKARIEKIDGDE